MTTTAPPEDIEPAALKQLLQTMILIRRFEETIVSLYGAQDMKTPVHLCIGQEAVAAGVIAHLQPRDYLFTTHRGHGHCLAKGMSPADLLAEFYGRANGCCRGKGGSMHPASPQHGINGTSAIVGASVPLAPGTALASYLRQDGRISIAFFGDGASDEGSFHESLNFASLKKLPVVFVCENNYYATNSPLTNRQPHPDIFERGKGYQIPSLRVDGNDVLAVSRASRTAVARARAGQGPTLLECTTYRWKGHVGPDCDHEQGCRPKEELTRWMKQCPVENYLQRLKQWGVITDDEISAMESDISAELNAAVDQARNGPFPELRELTQHVYFEKGEC